VRKFEDHVGAGKGPRGLGASESLGKALQAGGGGKSKMGGGKS